MFMIAIDTTVANLALPLIGRRLHAPVAGLQWTIARFGLIGLGEYAAAGGQPSSSSFLSRSNVRRWRCDWPARQQAKCPLTGCFSERSPNSYGWDCGPRPRSGSGGTPGAIRSWANVAGPPRHGGRAAAGKCP
jgi:hypothetical protein